MAQMTKHSRSLNSADSASSGAGDSMAMEIRKGVREEVVRGSWTNAPRCSCRIEIDADAKMHVYHDSSCRLSTMPEERLCEECGHAVKSHDQKYGCEVERGDGVRPGRDCAEALGPCGCTAQNQSVREYPVIWVQRDFAPGYEQWFVMLDWPELVELVPNLQPRTNDNRQIIQRYCNGERGRLLAEEHAGKLRALLTL